jgi:hypothetical protein
MTKVFSFTLFGSDPKYTKGLLKNIRIIEEKFPDWEAWIYCGDEISEDICFSLHDFPFVRLLPTHASGMVNKFYRFFAIDDPSVEICIIRDADSRIYERDEACIKDFLESDRLTHIIRDHPNHHHKMMAGMWGIRREAIQQCLQGSRIRTLFEYWKQIWNSDKFWSDTEFLCQMLYPQLVQNALIHDETQHFEPPHMKRPFQIPLTNDDFIGQVYEFSNDGTEVRKFPYNA